MSKHYKIARGEAMECAASLDVLKVRHLIEQPRYERGMELLESVVAMLTKMIKVDQSTLATTVARTSTAPSTTRSQSTPSNGGLVIFPAVGY